MPHTTTFYFDYAAATPVSKRVRQAMEPYFTDNFYNPSALYLASRDVRLMLANYRQQVAKVIGARSTEIVFTSGATEANNFAIHGVMDAGDECLISAVEHESVRLPARHHKCQLIPVDNFGRLILPELKKLITDKTKLISCIFVSNEVGTVQLLSQISEIVKNVRTDRLSRGVNKPLYIHTDASQAPLYFDIQVNRLGVDMMTLGGGKIFGPKQSGCLYVKTGTMLKPLMQGGGQEFGLRSGTESLAQISGFSTALVHAREKSENNNATVHALRAILVKEIQKVNSDIKILGHHKFVSPHIIALSLPSFDNERVVMELDQLGLQIATGSACKASDDKPSEVLLALGLTEQEAQSSVRVSFGPNTTEEDVRQLLAGFQQVVAP